jgi:hypothetical protein
MKPETIARWCALLDELKDLLRETFSEPELEPEPAEEPPPVAIVQRETIGRRGLAPPKGNLIDCKVCGRPIPSRAYELHVVNCSQAARGEFDERSIVVGGR